MRYVTAIFPIFFTKCLSLKFSDDPSVKTVLYEEFFEIKIYIQTLLNSQKKVRKKKENSIIYIKYKAESLDFDACYEPVRHTELSCPHITLKHK